MNIANPFALLFLTLLVPLILLHLLQTKKKKINFPAISILIKVAHHKSNNLKLRKWLLFILRALLIMLFAGAASMPSIYVWRAGGIRSGLPIAQVIIIDDSASMRYVDSTGESAFEKAIEFAQTEIRRLRQEDSVLILLNGHPPRKALPEFTTDKEIALSALRKMSSSLRKTDNQRAIQMAKEALLNTNAPNKEILLISDLATNQPSTLKDADDTNFRILPVLPKEARQNISIDKVTVVTGKTGTNRDVTIEAMLSNSSLLDKNNAKVSLNFNNQLVAVGTINLPAGQSVKKEFNHRFLEKGIHYGYLEIEEDALDIDNKRYFSINIKRSLEVLIINGDFRPGSYLDEAFYLQKALDSNVAGQLPVIQQVVDPEAALSVPFEGFDVIFLAGLNKISARLGERLVSKVESGGSVFISAGKNPDYSNISSIMPASIISVRQLPENKALSIGAIDFEHFIFSNFKEGETGLEKALVHTHFLFKPETQVDRNVIVALEDGMPLLLERKIGNSIVLLLATSIDRDWTNLPIVPGYLPLVQRSIKHLAWKTGQKDPKNINVGESIALEVLDGMRKLTVVKPDEKQINYHSGRLTSKTQIWFNDTTIPGIYRVFAELPGFGGLIEMASSSFTVNVDPLESQFNSIDIDSENKQLLDSDEVHEAVRGKLPIWSYLLLLGIFILFLETLLIGRKPR